jgi:hypothetical protein
MPESRTVHAVGQAEKSESRHLPLVDLLIDTRAELTELVVRSGMKVLEVMLEIVQGAVAEALNAIYEADFVGFSYGFRAGVRTTRYERCTTQ